MIKKAPECAVECTGKEMYVVFDGVRIAKRGKRGTPQAKIWVSLEPGYAVYDTADLSQIVIERSQHLRRPNDRDEGCVKWVQQFALPVAMRTT
jgi:hypothetical protein